MCGRERESDTAPVATTCPCQRGGVRERAREREMRECVEWAERENRERERERERERDAIVCGMRKREERGVGREIERERERDPWLVSAPSAHPLSVGRDTRECGMREREREREREKERKRKRERQRQIATPTVQTTHPWQATTIAEQTQLHQSIHRQHMVNASYRVTSLIRNTSLLGPYRRAMPRALRWS